MSLPSKIYYRLKREARDWNSFLRASFSNPKPNDSDLVLGWTSNPPKTTPEDCAQDWIKGKSSLFSADLSDKVSLSPEYTSEADLILKGSTHLFGKKADLTLANLWVLDPLTHNAWPSDIHYSRFSVFHPSQDGKTDIRRLWELGRFGWSLSLARAYAQTQNLNHASIWKKFLLDFISTQPPEFGPHWLNAMEPAIRAIQWIRAYSIFTHSKTNPFPESSEIHLQLLLSLLQHGDYIFNHLEWTPRGRTNHYLSNLVGLFCISTFIPQWHKSDYWKTFSMDALEREIEIQTDCDGFHAEASTAYHHFVTELYALTAAVDFSNRSGFSTRFLGRIRQMIEVDLAIRGKKDIDPRLGDDDSGCLFSNSENSVRHFREIFPWKIQRPSLLDSREFPASGIYILRSPSISCHISCGPNGQEGVGGHAHNDKLSMVVHYHGKPFVIDSGTYCYSADTLQRDLFRSTASHNTLQFSGKEQNPLRDWRALQDTTQARKLAWEDSKEQTVFSGEHSGYQFLNLIHRRTVTLDKNESNLKVLDEISGTGNLEAVFRLHFAPQITRESIRIDSNQIVLPIARIQFENKIQPEIEESEISLIYGEKIKNQSLVIRFKTSEHPMLSWEIRFIGQAGTLSAEPGGLDSREAKQDSR